MKTALTEQEFKAILQDAYQAGERASERNKEIDRLLDGGTKSCPAQPSFENYYQSMLAMQPIEAEKEAIEFNKYTQELPKQEERDVSKGEIEKAKTTAKANKLIKMFDDAIEGKLRQPNHVLKGEVYNLLVECLSVNSPSIPTLPDRL